MIVVGVDGSEPSKEALRWAARQAELTSADLHVVAAWEYPTAWGWAPPYPERFDPEGDTRRVLEATVEEALGSSADVELVVLEDRPAPALLRAAADAELLVVGSRGRGEFVGMVLGSVSEHCVHHARCPVVVVHSRAEP